MRNIDSNLIKNIFKYRYINLKLILSSILKLFFNFIKKFIYYLSSLKICIFFNLWYSFILLSYFS